MVLPDRESSLVEDDEIPFKCDICNLGFIRKDILDKHKSAVHESARNSATLNKTEEIQCKICEANFTSVQVLEYHIAFVHDVKTPFNHYKNQQLTAPRFEPMTPQQIKNPSRVTNSQGDIQIRNPEVYCEICKRDFSSKYYLKTHKNNCHGNISHQNEEILNDAQGEISIEIQDVWSIGGDNSKKSESPESSEGKRLRTVFTKVS